MCYLLPQWRNNGRNGEEESSIGRLMWKLAIYKQIRNTPQNPSICRQQ